MYVRGYLQGSENGRVVTIGVVWFVRHWVQDTELNEESRDTGYKTLN
jgi:hypothetical protein